MQKILLASEKKAYGSDMRVRLTLKFLFCFIFFNLKHVLFFSQKTNLRDFPGGALVENPPANAGGTGSTPGLGRSHMLQSN